MSGLVNKIKEAVHPSHGSQPEGTSGPHNSRAANAADPRVDSDRDHRAAPGGLTGNTGGYSSNNNYTTGATTTAGPHSSNLANKADPRVDSDRDGRGLGHGTTGAGLTGTHGTSGLTGTHGTSGLTGTHGTHGTHGTAGLSSGPAPTTAGPHKSDMMNKADPRVDSDRDGRGLGHGTAGTGATGTHGTSGLTGTHGTSGLTGTHATTGTHGTSGLTGTHGTHATAGPHSSNIANKADPRVDSDRDGRGLGHGAAGTSATHATTGTHGTSGLTGTHGTHTGAHTGTHGVGGVAGSGPGPAPNTAGPHKSDMMNKMDPRVDSNLDGSKTVGGNKTYQAGTTAGYHKDPTDAAQVPPSVLQKTVGPPVVEHGDHGHHDDRIRRNSAVTHQEAHRGI